MFLILILWIASSHSFQQEDIRTFPEDISDRLLTYDPISKDYVQAVPGTKSRTYRLHLDHSEVQYSQLEIIAPGRNMLLAEGNVVALFDENILLALDSLVRGSYITPIQLTIYNPGNISNTDLKIRLYSAKLTSDLIVEDSVPRKKNTIPNFALMGSLIILFYLAVLLHRFPKDSSDYSLWFRSFYFQNREETLMNTRPFSRNNMLFMILNALLIGFCLQMLIVLDPGTIQMPTHWLHFDSIFLGWIELSFFSFAFIALKYVLISMFNGMFNLGDFRVIQFLNSIRFSLGTFFLGFVFIITIYLTMRQSHLAAYAIIAYVVALLLLIRTAVFFFKLMNYSRHAVFHLFSYLCATEIIPFLMLYKLILG